MFYWDLPGGKMEYGEFPQQTVIREVKEETDLDIKVVRQLESWWFFSSTSKHEVVCITYLCSADKLLIDLSKNPADEHIQEYKWVTKEDFFTGKYPFLNDSIRQVIELL